MRFGRPIKNKRSHNPRYGHLLEDAKLENNSSRNMHDVQFYLEEFYPFCKEVLGFEKDATIVFESDFKNAKDPLGKTAHYDPSTLSVSVYVDKRHPKDIMRSVAHELVHHHQNVRGDLQNTNMEEGYAQNDDHLREMEREAYEKGNMLFRDWEDHRKNGGDDSLMARIMEKWGFDTSALTEAGEGFEEGQLVTVVASALAVDGEKTGTVVSFDDPAVLIKLDDDQEGKYVPDDKMVKVKKDYVEARAESGFVEGLEEDMYDDDFGEDSFDMTALEREFPWLSKSVKAGEVPADVAAELAAEFGEDEPEEEEELAVMKEAEFIGHHAEIEGKVYVDSNFLNSVKKIRDTFPHELKSAGFGEFYLETPKGKVQFDRSRGQSVQGTVADFVGRAHQLYGEPPELADELMAAMEAAGASEAVSIVGVGGSDSEGHSKVAGTRPMEEAELDTSKMSKKDFVKYVQSKHSTAMPTIDKERYSDLSDQGLEGPFQYRSGRILYYDTKEGKYYDRGQDMYLDDEEAAQVTMEGFQDRLDKFNKKQKTAAADKLKFLKQSEKDNEEKLKKDRKKTESKQGDGEMNLEEIVRQAVRTAIREKKYRREDEEEETVEEKLSPGQEKLDLDDDGKIEPSDLKGLRAGKEDEDVGEEAEEKNEAHQPWRGKRTMADLDKDAKTRETDHLKKDDDKEKEDDDEKDKNESLVPEEHEPGHAGGTDPVEVIGSLVHQHGFLNVREALEQMGFKVDFVTNPLPMYMLEKDGVKYAALNKQYAEDPDLVVGETAIGRMNEMLIKEGPEISDKNWYDTSLFESLMKKWAK